MATNPNLDLPPSMGGSGGFVQGSPGLNPSVLAKLSRLKLPAPPNAAARARLAAAIARLPNVPKGRGNAVGLFLP